MTMKIGNNVLALAYYTANKPFLDAMKMSSTWATRNAGSNTNEEAHLLTVLDANGYPTTLTDGGHTYTSIRKGVGVNGFGAPPYRGGNLVLLYDGTGTVTSDGGDTWTSVVSTPGRITFTITTPTTTGLYVAITATDPGVTGDYVRNIRVVEASHEALLNSGEIYHPEFIAQATGFQMFRVMDAMGTNVNNEVNWTDRKPVGYHTYADDDSGLGRYMPYEVHAALCNKLNADCWVNTPLRATDSYMTSQASLYHSTLNSNLNCYPELYNEAWLGFLLGADTARPNGIAFMAAAKALSPTPKDENGVHLVVGTNTDIQFGIFYWMIRGVKNADLWLAAWGADASRCFPVLGGWHAQNGNGAFNDVVIAYQDSDYFTGAASTHYKAFTTATYWATDYPYPVAWSTDVDGGVAKVIQESSTGGVLPVNASAVTTSGTSSAFTATWGGGTPVHGSMVPIILHTTPTGATTLTVGGVTAPLNFVKDTSIGSSWDGVPTMNAVYTTSTSLGACTPQWIHCNCGYANATYGNGWINGEKQTTTADKAAATAAGLVYVNYEGNFGCTNTTPEIATMVFATLRNSGFKAVYTQFLDMLNAIGVSYFNNYGDIGGFAPGNTWGVLEDVTQTSSPRYDAMKDWITAHGALTHRGGKGLRKF